MLKRIWFLQLLAEGAALVGVWKINLLPEDYFLILCGALLLLSVFTGGLMLPKRASRLSSGFGVFLSVILFVLSCGAAVLVMDANDRIQGIAGHTGNDLTLAVYVHNDDPAQSIDDAADYRYAVVRGYETERTAEAVTAVENALGVAIDVQEYSSARELVEAFFSDRADALIINSAYVNLLEELDGYENFHQQVRILYEVRSNAWSSLMQNLQGGSDGKDDKASVTKDPFIIYVSGSDTRNKKLSTSRSDVNIMAVINPKTKQILLLNTPRDYYIPNPASGTGALDKLTHCGIYGIECSMQALSDLYGTQIDYYAQINFTGFETLIDAIGGITVHCDQAFTSNDGVHFSKGPIRLNGANALTFARERYHLTGGDNARGQNQMKVITAVIDQLTSGTTLLGNYAGIMESLEGMFATSMTSSEISGLVKMQLRDMAQWNIVSYAVTGSNGSEITYSMPGTKLYVMHPNQEMVAQASALIQKVFNGEVITETDVTNSQ